MQRLLETITRGKQMTYTPISYVFPIYVLLKWRFDLLSNSLSIPPAVALASLLRSSLMRIIKYPVQQSGLICLRDLGFARFLTLRGITIVSTCFAQPHPRYTFLFLFLDISVYLLSAYFVTCRKQHLHPRICCCTTGTVLPWFYHLPRHY
jgi:hypothetical protein